MEKPIIYLDIEEDDMYSGVEAIAFVDNPAIDMDWFAYNKEKKPTKFAKDDTKRIITSPVMLADTPIYRYNEEMGEYYVAYKPEAIFKMRNKFMMESRMHQVNEDHDSKKKVEGVYMVESFITGDKIKSELFDVPDGSWVASWFIKDPEYYNKLVTSDDFNGVSLEGYFVENYEAQLEKQFEAKLRAILESDKHDLVKEQQIKRLVVKK